MNNKTNPNGCAAWIYSLQLVNGINNLSWKFSPRKKNVNWINGMFVVQIDRISR